MALELLFLDGNALAVELTVERDGTPLRHYCSPLAAGRRALEASPTPPSGRLQLGGAPDDAAAPYTIDMPAAGGGEHSAADSDSRQSTAGPLQEGQPADAPTATGAAESSRDDPTGEQQHADPCFVNQQQAAPAHGTVGGSSTRAEPAQRRPDLFGSGAVAVSEQQPPAAATASGSEPAAPASAAAAEQPDALASVLSMLQHLLSSSDAAAAAAAEHRQQQQVQMQQQAVHQQQLIQQQQQEVTLPPPAARPAQAAPPVPSDALQPVGPTAAPPSPAPLPAPAAALPGGVKKLLALELEVRGQREGHLSGAVSGVAAHPDSAAGC